MQIGDVFAKVWYTKEQEESLKQEYYEPTETTYCNFRIKFNKFEINFNKRLPKFKNYDTIETNKKLKLFSNFYIPVELKKVEYIKKNLKSKEYTIEELSSKLQEELKKQLLSEKQISEKDVIQWIPTITTTDTGVRVKLTCVAEKKIGVAEQLVY